jgi:hypothetical protein
MAELLDDSDHPVVLAQTLLRREGQHRVDEGDVAGDGARGGVDQGVVLARTGHRAGV